MPEHLQIQKTQLSNQEDKDISNDIYLKLDENRTTTREIQKIGFSDHI